MTIHIPNLPLKDMGEALLAIDIEDRAEVLGFGQMVKDAIRLASYAHQGQTRANRGPLPRDTYLTHPLRNALRLLRYGVTDADIIVAEILHDVVEDAAKKIVNEIAMWTVNYKKAEDKDYFRNLALHYIDITFNSRVALLVEAVSNPILVRDGAFISKDMTRANYQAHVISLIQMPEAAVVKFSDLVDNAVGLMHNTGMSGEARNHLALKYLPLLGIFEERIQQPDVVALLTEQGVREGLLHLAKGKEELAKIIAEF